MTNRRSLKAFISYKWDDDARNKWVEEFATDLRANGIDSILDRWEVRYGDSFTDYMTSKINDADVFLFIMTTRSVTAAEAPRDEGGAVKFEMQMATARRIAGENMRLIGIYREGSGGVAHLRDHRYADFRDDSQYESRFKELVDDLLGVDKRPPLGGKKTDSPLEEGPAVDVPILEEDDWSILLERIRKGRIVPFLGPGAYFREIPFEQEVAQQWIDECHYSADVPVDLSRVSQLIAVDHMPGTPIEWLSHILNTIESPDLTQIDEPHAVLATLPLTVYLTTNYDDFLMRALRSENKNPQREFCHWNSWVRGMPAVFDNSEYRPTVTSPLVFHFYGHTEIQDSMVLTENDYLDFLVNVSEHKDVIPVEVARQIASCSPLFLGYRLSDAKFRTLFRILRPHLQHSGYRPVGRFQITKKMMNLDLRSYFRHSDSLVRPLPLRDFMRELRTRWSSFCSRHSLDT